MILIGPQAQEILAPYMTGAWCFQRKNGQPQYRQLYYAAVRQATLKAGVPCWFPNQLRHTAGTVARKEYGLEGAQVQLGHSKANVTEIYAERDMDLAAKIARELG